MDAILEKPHIPNKQINVSLDSVVIRFAGDSGDGMQLTGLQFMEATALFGNNLRTFPDYPAEIRAPAGTTYGVSAYQINFGSEKIHTSGDEPDVLVAMNPAALKVNLSNMPKGSLIIIDTGSFNAKNLQKAGYAENPLNNGTLNNYRCILLDISKMTIEAVKEFNLSNKESLRSKNMWTLGLVLWMYNRSRNSVITWLQKKFLSQPELANANIAALNAGHAFGETAELSGSLRQYAVTKIDYETGTYRAVTGSEALAWGLVAGAKLAELPLFFGSYPITPASPLLHQLANLKKYGVTTFQAEDEIAAIGSAIGASFAGSLGVTSSSGPGIALKTEAIGLAISTELPLVIVNSQRGGPSTGLPTKTEQSDLYQAVYGRNGDAPLPVIAAATPSDCFNAAIESIRLATKYMTPVILLTDGQLANGSEPWRLPRFSDHTPFPVKFRTNPEGFTPFVRNPETLARNWAIPGTPGMEHRIGGIEKDYYTGNISYEPDNHQRMTDVRRNKVLGIAKDIPLQSISSGQNTGELAIISWGSTYGRVRQAVEQSRLEGLDVSHIHIRYLVPFPQNLGELLKGFKQLIVAEMNNGQLKTLLRDHYPINPLGLNKVSGQPFKVSEIRNAIRTALVKAGN